MTPGKKKKQELPELSGAQIEIMNVVWEKGEVSVAQVWKEIRQRRDIARNTIQTLIARLRDKGWLTAREQGNRYLYSASRDKRGTMKKLVSRFIDTAFEGSAEDMMMALLDSRGVAPDEAERIRKMIEKAEAGED